MEENVFKELRFNEVPYSVVITKNHFTDSADYFVIIHKIDREKMYHHHFIGTTTNKMTKEFTLREHEIEFFKDSIDEYKKVINGEFGVVYEQKKRSFKDYYKTVESKLNRI